MRRIIICLLALFISVAVSAQVAKKKKKTPPPAAQSDSSAVKKDSTADQKASDDGGGKFDYKKANAKAAEEDNDESAPATKSGSGSNTQSDSTTTAGSKSSSNSKSASGSKTTQKPTTKPKPAPKPKPMTAAEKKKAAEEAEEIEAATPKGVEALYYKFPVEYLPVVKEFLDYKQSESPHAKIKDDITTRKQIIRFKDIDRGYMMLQKPGDNKYTKLQIYKMNNGNLVMAVEQSNCVNAMCSGTLQFYTKSAGGWKDATEDYYPQIDYKFVIDRLRSAYKKEYKDLELYNAHDYEDNDANLKKAITYQISPDDGSIVIQEQNLPCKLYSMTWDPKKEKFDLKKVEK